MKKHKRTDTRKALITAALSAVAACGASAYEVPLSFFGTNMPPLDFHGFASQGFLYSSDYNYLGDTTHGSFQYSEFGLNAAINPFPRTRISVQGFSFDVGNVGQYNLSLDYAQAEYTFCDQLGVRVGRVRRPQGIYNHIQDVDLARTSVLLPQGIYDSRWRDFSGSLDGGEIFGNFSLGKGGSLSYEAYIGAVNMNKDGGVARELQDRAAALSVGSPFKYSYQGIDQSTIFGVQFWYNTPVDGLRAGVSVGDMQDFGYELNISNPFPPGTPGVPLPPGTSQMHTVGNIIFQQYSLEYIWRAWTFQAEYYNYQADGHDYYSFGASDTAAPGNPESWYAGVSYRFNKWVQAGAYYSEFYGDMNHVDDPANYQKDLAVSLRFDPKDWWIVKIEGHYIHGTGELYDSFQPTIRDDRGWFMLAMKTTFSF